MYIGTVGQGSCGVEQLDVVPLGREKKQDVTGGWGLDVVQLGGWWPEAGEEGGGALGGQGGGGDEGGGSGRRRGEAE